MVEQTNTQPSNMLYGAKILLGFITVGVVIWIIIAVGNPFFKMLKNIFGAGAAAAGIIQNQLNKCSKSLFAKGCYLGFFGIGYLAAMLATGAATLYSSIRGGKDATPEAIESSTGSDKSLSELAEKSAEKAEKIMDRITEAREKSGKPLSENEKSVAREMAVNRATKETLKEGIEKSESLSSDDRKKITSEIEQRSEIELQEIKKSAEAEEVGEEDVEDIENDIEDIDIDIPMVE